MILETERLFLSTWQPSDWIAFRPIATDVEVLRYITGGVPWTDERIQSFVNRQAELLSERGFCRWKLLLKPAQEMIGFCGVGFWGDSLDPEIGWWLARPYWGRGLATEAARQALRDALERVGLDRIISIARPANVASTRIMEKLGFQLECEFEKDGVRLVRYAIHSPHLNHLAFELSAPNITTAMVAPFPYSRAHQRAPTRSAHRHVRSGPCGMARRGADRLAGH